MLHLPLLLSLPSSTPLTVVRDCPESEKHDDFLNPIDSSSDAGGFLEIEPLSQPFEKRFEASPTNNSSEASHALREGLDKRIQRQLELKWGKDRRRELKMLTPLISVNQTVGSNE